MAKSKKPTIDEVISKAVMATRLSCEREARDVFKATEKRLYAYPVLQAKKRDDEEMLEEITKYGLHERSKSITRFIKSGVRLLQYQYFEQKTDEEIADLMHCAPRTVRAHKSRLVGRLSVFLYGAAALV